MLQNVSTDDQGVTTKFHLDNEGTFTTERIQDFTPIHEDAKARQAMGITGSSDMKHAARFPVILIEKYCNDRGITFQEWINNPHHVKVMLSDPALNGFRIWNGRV